MNAEQKKDLQYALEFVDSELGFGVEETRLRSLSLLDWMEFCDHNGYDVNTGGVFNPGRLIAYVNEDSDFFISHVFHELFGHGLFCEHSSIGKNLVDIVRSEGDARGFLDSEVNPYQQQLGLMRANRGNYEGFAVWTEDLLARETGNEDLWLARRKELPYPEQYEEMLEYFKQYEERLTRFGLLAQMGFPKHYDSEDLRGVLRGLYGDSFSNISLAVLYGSQKPEKDIDLFVVTEGDADSYFNGWLDIYGIGRRLFEERARNLDISVVDPLFSGELIHGDENYFERMRSEVLEQPVTAREVSHNFRRAEENKVAALQSGNSLRQIESSLSYVESYRKHALALKSGLKPLTLRSLEELRF